MEIKLFNSIINFGVYYKVTKCEKELVILNDTVTIIEGNEKNYEDKEKPQDYIDILIKNFMNKYAYLDWSLIKEFPHLLYDKLNVSFSASKPIEICRKFDNGYTITITCKVDESYSGSAPFNYINSKDLTINKNTDNPITDLTLEQKRKLYEKVNLTEILNELESFIEFTKTSEKLERDLIIAKLLSDK